MPRYRYLKIGIYFLMAAGVFHLVPAVVIEIVSPFFRKDLEDRPRKALEMTRRLNELRAAAATDAEKTREIARLGEERTRILSRNSHNYMRLTAIRSAKNLSRPAYKSLALIAFVFFFAQLIYLAISDREE